MSGQAMKTVQEDEVEIGLFLMCNRYKNGIL
jgi:hypothetical protein